MEINTEIKNDFVMINILWENSRNDLDNYFDNSHEYNLMLKLNLRKKQN